MLKNILQKVFNFAPDAKGEKNETREAGDSPGSAQTASASEAVSECFTLLRLARLQKDEKLRLEALTTFEKIVAIIEREGL